MQAINQVTANLEVQLQQLSATPELGGRQLTLCLNIAHELLQQTKIVTKSLNNQMLSEFLNANIIILSQLEQSSQTLDAEATILSKSNEVMLQLTHMYQDAIVPLLTRLHNLSNDGDNSQKITSITSLGNEIITCTGQINQFSDKFVLNEKIFVMMGIVLMLSSISMLVAILSKPSIEIPLLAPLTIMSLGSGVCKKAMETHTSDPGTDLITTSIKKIEPQIYDVAQIFTNEGENNKVILRAKEPAKKAKAAAKAPEPVALEPEGPTKTELKDTEALEAAAPSGKFLEKIKGVLDIFSTKK